MEHTLQGPGVRENDVVSIKGEDPRLGDQNLLGAFGDGTYYYKRYDDDKQAWLINRLEPAKAGEPIRYGDKVRLTNRSYGQNLYRRWNALSNHITVASESDYWVFVSTAAPNVRTEVRTNERLFLQASDGRMLDMPGNETYYYGIADEPDIRTRAASGTVRAKPADEKPTAPGKSPLAKKLQIEASALCRCWHPSQAWLEVERLKGLYLTAEIEGPLFKDLGDELFRWQELLSPLSNGDPKKGADPPALSADMKDGLNDASAKLNGMINTCIKKLDYFHNKRDFAPNVTFNHYASALKDTLGDLKIFEQRYNTLLDEMTKQGDVKDKASMTFDSAVATIAAAKERFDELRGQLDEAAALIKSRSATVDRLVGPFRNSEGDFESFRNEVKNSFNCDMKDILQGLEMMVFAPPSQKGAQGASELSGAGVAMAGVQLAKFIEHGMTTIKTAAGKEVEKSEVISSVTEIQDALFEKDAFGAAKQVYRDATGRMKDESGPRILATLDKLDKLVGQFANLTTGKKIQYDIRALSDAVRARGDAIVDFNIKLMQAIMLQKMIDDSDEQRLAALKEAAKLDNPALPAMVSFLARQYQYVKDAAIEQVYLANRAAAFWMLDDGKKHPANGKIVSPINVFRQTLEANGKWSEKDGGDMYGAIGWDVLAGCRDRLQDAFLNGLEKHCGVSQPFPSDGAGGAQVVGEQIIITDNNVLSAFKQKQSTAEGKEYHSVAVRISREGGNGTFTGEHLRGYANIHLSKFRVFLNGVRAKKWIHIRFEHDSSDVYYNENGEPRTFSRRNLEPRTFAYDGSEDAPRYEIDTDTKKPTSNFKSGYIHIDGDIGSGGTPQEMARDDQHAIYVGVGPFSEWTLTVVLGDNPGLDVTGLSSIEIQLCGIFRTSKSFLAAHGAPASIPPR